MRPTWAGDEMRPDDGILLRMVEVTPAALVVLDAFGRFRIV